MRRQSGSYAIAPRLIAIDASPGSATAVDAVERALRSGPEPGAQRGLIVEPFTDRHLLEAHALVLADGAGGEWACSRAPHFRDLFHGPVFVVAEGAEQEMVLRGYEAGVHAWHTLPLCEHSFRAQLESLVHRLVGEPDPPDVIVELHPSAHALVVDGYRVRLKPRGFAVFVYLLGRREIWTKAELIVRDVFRSRHVGDGSIVRNQVGNIRDALPPELAWILQGQEGAGYRVTLKKDSSAGRRGLPHPRYRRLRGGGGGVSRCFRVRRLFGAPMSRCVPHECAERFGLSSFR